MLGVPNEFINHGTQNELYSYCNYDASAIINTVHEILANSSISQVG